jgi:hypothetical protein
MQDLLNSMQVKEFIFQVCLAQLKQCKADAVAGARTTSIHTTEHYWLQEYDHNP